uniref:Uncharacterized protein n=1 Tax=virus sp. ctx9V1 TaxID=2828001 RepID=A0A8S5RCQ2_9VIRU|nr:MAG TPA: hypothetical protein [virus sp. ctx9V1]
MVNSLGRIIVSFTTGSTSTKRKACIDDWACVGIR